MNTPHTYSINAGGKLMDLSHPVVMGILNVTPDSFHVSINPNDNKPQEEIRRAVQAMLTDGADLIDVGGCSTRPGSQPVDAEEEWRRLSLALEVVRREAPDCIISVDTFRHEVAERCIADYGVEIVNDISGGNEAMYDLVASKGVPYILTYNETQSACNRLTDTTTDADRKSNAPILQRAMQFFSRRIQLLRDRGAKDIILDPGFGFNKTIAENYELLANLTCFDPLQLPLLAGISSKRMIYEVLGCTHDEAANGTTVLNTIALTNGADILRVHDVKAAKECVKLWETTREGVL